MKASPFSAAEAGKHGIFVVDGHEIARRGICRLLGGQPDFEVCGTSGTAPVTAAQVLGSNPELVIVDFGSGPGLVRELHAQAPALPILVLSLQHERDYAQTALAAGARGYLMKEQAIGKLPQVIRTLLSGSIYPGSSASPDFGALAPILPWPPN